MTTLAGERLGMRDDVVNSIVDDEIAPMLYDVETEDEADEGHIGNRHSRRRS